MPSQEGSRNRRTRALFPFLGASSGRVARLWALLLILASFGLAQQPPAALAAGPILVTTTADEYGANPGACSLREAIDAANTNAAFGGCAAGSPGADTITFGVNGTFRLTIAGRDDDSNATGDLDIAEDLTITGNGSSQTIIDGNGIDEILDTYASGSSTPITLNISGVTIQNGDSNGGSFDGPGGLYIDYDDTVHITASRFANNTAEINAGAIDNRGTLTIVDSEFTGNHSTNQGGAITTVGPTTITGSTFSGNQGQFGGAIWANVASGQQVSIANSTVSGNSTLAGGKGGGVYANSGNDGTIALINVTIAGNTASGDGGGIANDGPGPFNIGSTLIGNNSASGTGPDCAAASGAAALDALGNNLIEQPAGCVIGGTTTGDITGIDPNLGPLANNGGPTLTHALLIGSPAIDGGPATCAAAPVNGVDQRGQPRPGGAKCDIGAYEFSDTVPPDTTITATPTNPTNSTTATFGFSGSDNITPPASLTFECSLDGAAFAACTNPRTYTGLAAGPHTFAVRAKDQSGNVDPTPATYTWSIDTTAPTVANVTSSAANGTYKPGDVISIQVVFSEAVLVVGTPQLTLETGTSDAVVNYSSGGGSNTLTFAYTVAAGHTSPDLDYISTAALALNGGSIKDAAGNNATLTLAAPGTAGSLGANKAIVVDGVEPNTTFSSTPPATSNSASATFQFSGNDGSGSGISHLECSLDGAPFATCTSPDSLSSLSDGSHTFRVRAVDNAGNVETSPISFTWTVDTTSPTAPVVTTPANGSLTNNPQPPVTGTAEPGSTVMVYLDGSVAGTTTADASGNWSYTPTAALADGSHTAKATASDAAGNISVDSNTNSFRVDTTAPAAPVVTTPANGSLTNNPQPPATGTAEPNSTLTVYLDGTAAGTTTADASGNWSFTPPTPLSQGAHTVKARATDAAGNISVDSNTNTFTVDTIEPNTTFSSTPPATSNSTSASFQFTGSDSSGINRYECSLDGVAFATCTSPQSLAGLAEGSHTFRVRAVDSAGNVETSPASYTWTVDTTAPDTTITTTPPSLSNSSNAMFAFTGSDPVSGGVASGVASYECALDGGAFVACSSPQSLTGLADGLHTFYVRAVDAAGNVDATPASYTWTIDTIAPAAPVVTTPANGSLTSNPQPPVTGTAEPNSTVKVYLDGSVVSTTTADAGGNWSLTPPSALSDGTHTAKATAADAAGNTSPDSNTNSFTVDTTAPAAPVVLTPADGSSTNNNRPILSGTAEPGSTVTVYLDGSVAGTTTANGSGSWSYTPTAALPDGPHTVKATASDAAGNTGPDSNTNSFTVDTTAPAAPVVLAPANGSNTNNNRPPVSGTAEPNSTVKVYVDGGAVGTTTADASGNWSYTPGAALADGSHTVKATATDLVDSTGPDSNTNTFTVDTGAPDTTITANPPATSNSANASFSFSGDDGSGTGVASFECALDGAAFAACTSPQSYTGLADGSHTFAVRAVDVAGSVDATPASYTWTVEATPPDTTITANPPATSNSSSASLSFDGSDNVTPAASLTFECALDGGAFAVCTSPQSYTGLAEGSHTFAVRAIDQAGNVDATPASYTWTVDLTAPDTTITATPPANTNSPSANFSFGGTDNLTQPGALTFECSLDGAAFGKCASPQSYTGLADGSHTFAVRAIDVAGNVDATPASYTWMIDTTPLTVTIDQAAGQADPTGTAPISFTVVFNKPVSGFGDSAGDISLSGTAPGKLTASVSGGPSTYTVTVSGMTGSGTVIAAVNAGAATDIFGNTSAASTSTDNTVTFSPATPVVTGIVPAGANPTNAASVQFNVTFSEAVRGVNAADFVLATTGLSGASISGVSGSGTSWTVTVSTGSGSGTLGLNLVDDDSIGSVASGIALGGSGSGNGDFSGEVYTIDRAAPQATLSASDIIVAGGTAHVFTVTYTDNVALDAATLGNANLRVKGPGGFSQLATFVGATPAGNGAPRTATYRIAAPGGTWNAADNGAYTVTVEPNQVRDTAGNALAAGDLGTFNVRLGFRVLVPMVTLPAGLPDLVVDRIEVTSSGIQVTIRNQGPGTVTEPFWVDLYVNPTTAPTHVNQVWYSLGANGAAWGVTSGALPLATGQTLTLIVGDAYYRADLSNLPVSLAAGTRIYAQVDSANTNTTYGAVLETHEQAGGPYNNILGVTTSASATLAGGAPAIAPAQAQPRMPARPARSGS
jgi:CSLREA domain-containing protein